MGVLTLKVFGILAALVAVARTLALAAWHEAVVVMFPSSSARVVSDSDYSRNFEPWHAGLKTYYYFPITPGHSDPPPLNCYSKFCGAPRHTKILIWP